MTTQLASDISSSTSAQAWLTASLCSHHCSGFMVQLQRSCSTSNMSNRPVGWARKKRAARRLPWA